MTRPPKQVVAVSVAAAVVVAAALVIVVLGGVTLPSYPSMADDPFPGVDGRVAFIRGDWPERCLYVVAADGQSQPSELRCDELYEPISWDEEDGTVVVETIAPNGPELTHIDPTSGDIVATESMSEGPAPRVPTMADRAQRDDGTSLQITLRERSSSLVRIDPDGTRTVLLEYSGYGRFSWESVGWSPDGQWAVVSDSEQRVFVVDPEDGDARLLVDDASAPAWGPGG